MGAALLLVGCTAVDETRQVFDIPLASDYQPIIARDKDFIPKRILVLPVFGKVTKDLREIYATEMLSQIKQPNYWTIVAYGNPSSGGAELDIDHYSAEKRANETGCDTILFVELSDHSIYDPIHFSATITMERVVDQVPVLNSRFDFDTRDRNVADSARRYYQSSLSRSFSDEDAPDKSLYILHNNPPFFKFAGYYTARLIDEVYQPPKPPNGAANTVTK